jgi:hypothetical protein
MKRFAKTMNPDAITRRVFLYPGSAGRLSRGARFTGILEFFIMGISETASRRRNNASLVQLQHPQPI